MKSCGPTLRPVGATSTMWNCTAVWLGETASSRKANEKSDVAAPGDRRSAVQLPTNDRTRRSAARLLARRHSDLARSADDVFPARRLPLLLRGGGRDGGDRAAGRLDVPGLRLAATDRAGEQPEGRSRRRSRNRPKRSLVGQITGTFDCQWADASTAAIDDAYVPLGRRYALASGLMEISYDTGAKVILQGPCIYQVESGIGRLPCDSAR